MIHLAVLLFKHLVLCYLKTNLFLPWKHSSNSDKSLLLLNRSVTLIFLVTSSKVKISLKNTNKQKQTSTGIACDAYVKSVLTRGYYILHVPVVFINLSACIPLLKIFFCLFFLLCFVFRIHLPILCTCKYTKNTLCAQLYRKIIIFIMY